MKQIYYTKNYDFNWYINEYINVNLYEVIDNNIISIGNLHIYHRDDIKKEILKHILDERGYNEYQIIKI